MKKLQVIGELSLRYPSIKGEINHKPNLIKDPSKVIIKKRKNNILITRNINLEDN